MNKPNYISIDEPFENSGQIKQRISEATRKVLAEAYAVGICRVLNLPGVEQVILRPVKAQPTSTPNYMTPFWNASKVIIKGGKPPVHDAKTFLPGQAKLQSHTLPLNYFEMELCMQPGSSTKAWADTTKQASKLLVAVRGCLPSGEAEIVGRILLEMGESVLTKANYQNFVAIVTGDPGRQAWFENQRLQKTVVEPTDRKTVAAGRKL